MNDGVNQYLYDGEDRICAVESDITGALTGYVYDAAGDRVGKGTITTFSCNQSSNGLAITSGYVVGLNGEQLTETNGGTGWLHTHVFANGELLAIYSSSDTLFELNDWLGTRRADVGVSGCETTWQSLPYGDGLTSSGNCNDTSELHFTGKERDQESGNDYFGARYYASAMGRFLSPDWSKNPQGVPYADYTNPQTLNLYQYMRNNPLGGTDPDGHCCEDNVLFLPPTTESIVSGAQMMVSNPYVQGGAQIAVGVGLVATAAGGDVPGGVAGALLVTNAVIGGTATAVNGTAQIVGTATSTDTSEARETLSATASLPGLVTAAGTGAATGEVNVKAAAAVTTLTSAATLAAAPREAVKNPATTVDAAQTAKETTGLVQGAVNAVKNWFSPQPPAPPKPPSPPSCSVAGACGQ